jgi:hypothetical protein
MSQILLTRVGLSILLVCPQHPHYFSIIHGSWTLGDVVATTQSRAAPFMPVITATVAVAAQSDIGKVIKDRIDKFSEGMPVLMNALDELKAVHPVIGGGLIQ